ncbi:acyl carrier protein, partial [Nocardia nova]|uniref:acyl carrier protein n=1 Tax=Nocardia nova TaxID=37330 RepID=UPI001C461E65
ALPARIDRSGEDHSAILVREWETTPALFDELAALSDHDRKTRIADVIKLELLASGNFEAHGKIPGDLPFKDLGVDSLMASFLRKRLNSVTGLTLHGAVIFDFPSVNLLAEYVSHAIEAASHPRDRIDELLSELFSYVQRGSTLKAELEISRRLLDLHRMVEERSVGSENSAGAAIESIGDMSDEEMFSIIDSDSTY